MIEWAIGLIAGALILYLIELFVPSGGIIGFFATLCLVGGLICLFWVNKTAGVIATIIVLIAAPFLIGFALKIFPQTPIGRMLTLNIRQKADFSDSQKLDENAGIAADVAIGAKGSAITDLRPVGTCKINGIRHECLAESGIIDSGKNVTVVAITGMEIKVREV